MFPRLTHTILPHDTLLQWLAPILPPQETHTTLPASLPHQSPDTLMAHGSSADAPVRGREMGLAPSVTLAKQESIMDSCCSMLQVKSAIFTVWNSDSYTGSSLKKYQNRFVQKLRHRMRMILVWLYQWTFLQSKEILELLHILHEHKAEPWWKQNAPWDER